jgi:hypothetical protein
MDRKRRLLAATELRVHLGEALKALETEDLVIEKGGVPVAILSRYDGVVYNIRKRGSDMNTNAAYEAALARRGNPAALPAALEAMRLGWVGVDSDELVAEIYAAREAGASARVFDFDEGEDEPADDDVPARQRRLQSRDEQDVRKVAEEPYRGYGGERRGD